MPGVSGNKSLSAPVKTLEEPEIIESSVILSEAKNLAEANTEPETDLAITDEANVTPETNNVIPSEAKNLAEANTEPETVEPSVIPSEAKNLAEANAEPESDLAITDEANVTHETNSVILSEAKNLAEANAEPESDLAITDEANVTHETNSVIPSEANTESDAGETLEEHEIIEPEITEPVETVKEPEIIEPAAAPVERQSETAEESVSIIDDELMRFKAATEGFDRLEKFTFKIFKDVFDNYSGVFVTARQTLADLLLFIAAKCKNAGKIKDFKRAFNVNKDFGKLNQSAANYIPVLLGLTLKLKAQSDFVSGVFNEIRGILLNIICDETAVEFELKILKQILF